MLYVYLNLNISRREIILKVVLIYRKKNEGAHSIEELFHSIARELSKQVEVIEYEAGSRWQIFSDIWQLRKLNADIYHVTGDINYLVLLLPTKKTILTVHDIGHYLFGLNGIKRSIYKWLWLVLPIQFAKQVTSVSKETKANIVNHLGINKRKIKVIENCYSPIFKPVAKKFSTKRPIILQVGLRPNKNTLRLIEALKGLHFRLVLIGILNKEIKKNLIECKINYQNLFELTHEEVYKEYLKCDLVSFISLNEGFGMPIIEAQASGRPLITSNISPMREIAGRGACLVNPLNVLQIRKMILKIITNSNYRNQLIKQGKQNVIRYSPTSVAGHYLDLYKKLSFQYNV
jgi:glycosyltransferase involved in cell wall biosynthesis